MSDPGTHFALSIIAGLMGCGLWWLWGIYQKLTELVELLKPKEKDEDD